MSSNEAVQFIEGNKSDGKKRLVITYNPSTAECSVAGPIFDVVLTDGMLLAARKEIDATRMLREMQSQPRITPAATLAKVAN